MRRMILYILVICAVTAGFSHASAAEPVEGKRLVHLFDFEEPDNLDPVPKGWIRIDKRDGFPSYNKAAFDDQVFFSPGHSVKLPTRGGSTGLMLPAGNVLAIGTSDYIVAAWVRTSGLKYARAKLSAVFYKGYDKPIEESRAETGLIQTHGSWELHYVELYGEYPQATHISIELTLLQPEIYRDKPPLPHEETVEDVSGAAWFDDVAIYKAPRLQLRTGNPLNIVTAPDEPELHMLIHDVARQNLTGRIRVLDLDGHVKDENTFLLVRIGREVVWKPHLEKFGWYQAVLDILDDSGNIVGSTQLAWAYLPPPDGSLAGTSERFGVIAEGMNREDMPELPELVALLGTGSVWLSAWDPMMTTINSGSFLAAQEPVLNDLLYQHMLVTLVLDVVPPDLADLAQVDSHDVLGLISLGHSVYSEFIDPVLVKFGQQTARWQLERTGSDDPLFNPALGQIRLNFMQSAQQFVPGAVLILPCDLEQIPDVTTDDHTAWTVTVPWNISQDAFANLARPWLNNKADSFVFEIPDEDLFTRRASVAALARRTIIAWTLNVPRMVINRPWETVGDARRQISPRPEFVVWQQLNRRLNGRKITSSFPVAEGVRAFILADENGNSPMGAIVAWNETAPDDKAVIRMRLGGSDVYVADLYGNESPAFTENGSVHVIQLTDEPVFIENVDIRLAGFRAHFGLHPATIESTFDVHKHFIEIHNPWTVTISGDLKLIKPETWDFSPRYQRFTVPAGATIRLPVDITFPTSESAGWHKLAADITVFADRPLVMHFEQEVKIGLKTVTLTPTTQTAGKDLIIMLQVVNTSDKATNYNAYVASLKYGRIQRPLGELQPGETRMVYFKLPGAAVELSGKNIRVGLVEVDGPGRLNKTVQVP